ncbi:MAG: 3-phosphoshikimate 1-carboxyvinyltransferase [Candidatus Melainabacteria bacterium]|nr:3-phosphoshikimate 1-carboxyvinyltransferase [Candidatus Melainabacteria bacterium]
MKSLRLLGELKVPGDKSISHRALIFSVLTKGTSLISGLSPAEDCASTARCLRTLGLTIEQATNSKSSQDIQVLSPGFTDLQAPATTLFAGNSGTTIRLLAGLLAGQPFSVTLDGDPSLRSRPMSRLLEPLSSMGAEIEYLSQQGYAPFKVVGGVLHGITFHCPVPSAQMQTALLLAGLFAEGKTTVEVPGQVRDHTLRLFEYLGVPYHLNGNNTVTVTQLTHPLPSFNITIPGDLSSAAFFLVAASLLPQSKVLLQNVGVNPGRCLVLDILKKMGANLTLENVKEIAGEPVADIAISWAGQLVGTTIDGANIATGIDEIPILSLAGALCKGVFSVRGASELKIKESNRLTAMVSNLRLAGAKIREYPDGFEIEGSPKLPGGSPWLSFSDHRIAMTGLIANLVSDQPIDVDNKACINISYPLFQQHLETLLHG